MLTLGRLACGWRLVRHVWQEGRNEKEGAGRSRKASQKKISMGKDPLKRLRRTNDEIEMLLVASCQQL